MSLSQEMQSQIPRGRHKGFVGPAPAYVQNAAIGNDLVTPAQMLQCWFAAHMNQVCLHQKAKTSL